MTSDWKQSVAGGMMLLMSFSAMLARAPEARAAAFGQEAIDILASAKATPRMALAAKGAVGAVGAIEDTFAHRLAPSGPTIPSARGQIIDFRHTNG